MDIYILNIENYKLLVNDFILKILNEDLEFVEKVVYDLFLIGISWWIRI